MKQLMQKLLLAGVLTWSATVTMQAGETISLAGKWRFEVAGTNAMAFKYDLPGRIHLPGTMDDAGLGPQNTNAPTLAGPWRRYDYAGPAWYQRDIEIPAGWQGKRVTLFLERCRWVTTVWLDDRLIGTQDSLIAPHVFDFGPGVTPGRHRLTLCVDNTVKLDLGPFVSALFGGTWGNMNGIVGRIELTATPPVWIDSVQVVPDVAKMQARLAVSIGNATGQPGQGQLVVNGHNTAVSWNETGGQAQVTVDLPGAKLWDEFAPNLTLVTVQLGADTRTVRFGMRDLAEQGTQFTLNGRPIFLRGTLECSVWPLTGYPPTDQESWRRIFRIEKSYGLNFIRFHSWCPPEAAFAVADEEGILIQVEGPQANVPAGDDPARDAFIEAEFQRIVDTYGNHPSFCLMTLGNEYGGTDALLTHWVDLLIHRDPRHLYASPSAGQTTANRQWTETPDGRGVRGPGTDGDLRATGAQSPRPIVGHEIGQWMYWPDFREIKKWNGVMALKNFELIRDDMEKKHLLGQEADFVQASGRFATLLYKEEIEVLLRTPGYGGFSLLDLHDYPTQGTALIGPLDAFWDSKGFITPEQFRRFCAPTVPLLRMAKRTYTNGEIFQATAEIAHYGAADLSHVQPAWSIKDEHGNTVAAGKLPSLTVPTGKLTELGEIKVPLNVARAPGKFTVTVSVPGTGFANDWDIWIYPANVSPQPPAAVTVCNQWEATKAALAAGKKVIFFPQTGNFKQSLRGSFLPVFWSPVWFPSQKPNTMGILCDPKNPLFAQFPTGMNTDWQWYNLMQRSRVFVLDDLPADYRPLVQVVDNFARNHKLGVVFEGRVGGGQLLVCGLNLADAAKDPAERQWLASLYAYAGSAKFKPRAKLEVPLLEHLFESQSAGPQQAPGTKIHADSQASKEYDASLAIDGDPDTLWHTPWEGSAPPFPHELVVELTKPVELAGITCLPRQDGNPNGWIRDYAVFTSTDGEKWGEPVAAGTFPQNDEWHPVKFMQPVKARFLKLVAKSSFNSAAPYASLAELNLIPGQP
ncbi:MAG TPA: discoidin domain-containing protein [Dongiaceae bacterium]|nr:discoidin domain-containing protein [Dongiaceae bacterium]